MLPEWMREYADTRQNARQGRRLMFYQNGVIYGAPHQRNMALDAVMDSRTQAFSIMDVPDFGLQLEMMPRGDEYIICEAHDEREHCKDVTEMMNDYSNSMSVENDPTVEHMVCLLPPDELEGF